MTRRNTKEFIFVILGVLVSWWRKTIYPGGYTEGGSFCENLKLICLGITQSKRKLLRIFTKIEYKTMKIEHGGKRETSIKCYAGTEDEQFMHQQVSASF